MVLTVPGDEAGHAFFDRCARLEADVAREVGHGSAISLAMARRPDDPARDAIVKTVSGARPDLRNRPGTAPNGAAGPENR